MTGIFDGIGSMMLLSVIGIFILPILLIMVLLQAGFLENKGLTARIAAFAGIFMAVAFCMSLAIRMNVRVLHGVPYMAVVLVIALIIFLYKNNERPTKN